MNAESRFQPDSLSAWRRWLESNHGECPGVWLVIFKKSTGKQEFGFDPAIEEALCFGWIDSLPRTMDGERTMLWFSPRKRTSAWSAVNKRRVEKLLAENRMHPSGLRAIFEAKTNGSWFRIDSASRLEVPLDLSEAFAGVAGSSENFAKFPPSARRAIFEWIAQARTPGTRRKRIDETARLAGINVRANQWRGRTSKGDEVKGRDD